MLLSHCHAGELIWNRLNALGYRVGLMELLGVFLAPALDGFSISKHLLPLGIQGLYERALCHSPPEAGALYQELKLRHGYPQSIDQPLTDVGELMDCGPEELSESDLWWVMNACGYHDLISIVEQNLRNGLNLTRDMLARFPADVIFFHTGYFDRLLHFFYGWGAEERDLMFLLDGFVASVEEILQPRNILIFSDHGMLIGPPHLSGPLLHRAAHDAKSALVAGSGRRVEAAMAAGPPPTDLCSVYDLVLRTLDPGAKTDAVAPPSPDERIRQLEQVVACRDQLLIKLCSKKDGSLR